MKIIFVSKRMADVFIGEGWGAETWVRLLRNHRGFWTYAAGNRSLSAEAINGIINAKAA